MSRHSADYAAEAAVDFEALLSVAAPILVEDHGLQAGELVRIRDITTELARSASALPSDIRLLRSLGQEAAAIAAVREGLVALHAIDPFVFCEIPTPRRLAMLMTLALPNCTDWASAVENASLDSSDIRRRTFAALARRMVAEDRAHLIPSEDDARLMAATPPPGHGGVAASRTNVPMQWIKPERSSS